jgi:hypothetical protein
MKFSISEKLSELLLNGYCFVPELTCTKASTYTMALTKKSGKFYEENNNLHLEYLKEYSIIEEMMPALANFANRHITRRMPLDDVYKVTRVITNIASQEAYRSHFDSHLFTLVTPINIPQDAQSINNGELILFNKIRKEPSNELLNLYGKIKFKKYYGKTGAESLQQKANFKIINLADKIPVLFLGRQCLHYNLPLAPSTTEARVTFLTHFFDISPAFGIGNLNRIFRGR